MDEQALRVSEKKHGVVFRNERCECCRFRWIDATFCASSGDEIYVCEQPDVLLFRVNDSGRNDNMQ